MNMEMFGAEKVKITFEYNGKKIVIESEPYKTLRQLKQKVISHDFLCPKDVRCYYFNRDITDVENSQVGAYFQGKRNVEIKLKNILSLQGGFSFDSKTFNEKGKFKVIKIGDIPNNLNLSTFNGTYSDQECDIKYQVSKGDILIALSGATFGKSGVIFGDDIGFINQRIAKFNCDKCDSKYIFHIRIRLES